MATLSPTPFSPDIVMSILPLGYRKSSGRLGGDSQPRENSEIVEENGATRQE